MKKLIAVILICASLIFNFRLDAYVNSVTPERVVEYLNSQVGKAHPGNRCLLFVSKSFENLGFQGRYGLNSAQSYWNSLKAQGRTNSSMDNIPIGADVFFKTNEFGHIGIYVGNGEFVHAGTKVYKTKLWGDPVDGNYYGRNYLGWAWHDYVNIKAEAPKPVEQPKTYPIPGNSSSDIANGVYYISYEASPNMLISSVNGSGTERDNIYIDDKGNGEDKNNKWRFERLEDDSFRITSVKTNLVMDLAVGVNEVGENKRNIHSLSWHGNNNQRWYVLKNNNNTYSFVSKWNGYYIDVEGAQTANGTNIYIYQPNGSVAQRFYLKKVEENNNTTPNNDNNNNNNTKPNDNNGDFDEEDPYNKIVPEFVLDYMNPGEVGKEYFSLIYTNVDNATYTLKSGSLPKGLTLNPEGNISGTPQEYGTFNFEILLQYKDHRISKEFNMLVFEPNQAIKTNLEFLDTGDIKGLVKSDFNFTFETNLPGSTYFLVEGNMPPGLQMDKSGYIYGIPSKSGVYDFTVEARNEDQRIRKPFAIEILGSMNKEAFQKVVNYKPGHFKDVSSNEWYDKWVGMAYEYGFVKGQKPNLFNPKGDITNAEVITIAARIHSIYNNTPIKEVKGAWYQKYVLYAINNKIIDASYVNKLKNNSSREECVGILHKSMPKVEYRSINVVDLGAIPDVSIEKESSHAIYDFYKAGILSGSDIIGTFYPDSKITRAEISKVIVCMVNETMRTTFSLNN